MTVDVLLAPLGLLVAFVVWDRPLMLLLVLPRFGFSFEGLATRAAEVHKNGARIMGPGTLLSEPVSAVSLSLGLLFGVLLGHFGWAQTRSAP